MPKLFRLYDEGARPIDGNARTVIFGQRGDNVDPPEIRQRWGSAIFTAPPNIKKIPNDLPDLTGSNFGKFTVFGLAAKSSHDGARWVVKCQCGYYELRSTKSVRLARSTDMCAWCIRTKIIKEKDAGITRKRAKAVVHRSWTEQPVLRESRPSEADLVAIIGEKAGKMTLVGPLAGEKEKWVLRCDCGIYETRKTYKLRRPKRYFMQCASCSSKEIKKSGRETIL
jgi:hypothetical protein